MPLFTAPESAELTLEESPSEAIRPDVVEQPIAPMAPEDQFAPAAYEGDFDVEEAEFVEESPEEYTPPARPTPPQPARPSAVAPSSQPASSPPVQRKSAAPRPAPAVPSAPVKQSGKPSTVARSESPAPTPAAASSRTRPASGPDNFPAVPRGQLPGDLSAIFSMHKARGFADYLPTPENVPDTPKVDPQEMARAVQRTPAASPEPSESGEPSIPTPSSESVRVRGRRRSKVMEIIPDSTRASMEAEESRKARLASQYLGDQAAAAYSPTTTPVQRTPDTSTAAYSPTTAPVQRTPDASTTGDADNAVIDAELLEESPPTGEAEAQAEQPRPSAHPAAQSVQRLPAESAPLELEDVAAGIQEDADSDSDSGDVGAVADTVTPSQPKVARTASPTPVQRTPMPPASKSADESAVTADDQAETETGESPAQHVLPAVQRSERRPAQIQRAPELESTSTDDADLLDYSDDEYSSSFEEQPVDLYQAMVSSGIVRPEPETPPSAEPSADQEPIPTIMMPPIGRPGPRNKHMSTATPNTVAAKRDTSAPQLNTGESATGQAAAPSRPQLNAPSPNADYMQNMQTMIDFPTVQRSPDDASTGADSDSGEFAASEDSDDSSPEDASQSYTEPTPSSTPQAQAVQRTPDLTPTKPRMPASGETPDSAFESEAVDFATPDVEIGADAGVEMESPPPTAKSTKSAQRRIQRVPSPEESGEAEDTGAPSPAAAQRLQRAPADDIESEAAALPPDSSTPDYPRVQRRALDQPSAPDISAPDIIDSGTPESGYNAAEQESTGKSGQTSAARPRRSVQRQPAPPPDTSDILDADEFGLIGDFDEMGPVGEADDSASAVSGRPAPSERSVRRSVQRTPDADQEGTASESQDMSVDMQAELLQLLNLPADTPVYRGPTSGTGKPGSPPSAQRMPAEPSTAVQRMIADDIGTSAVQRALTESSAPSASGGTNTESQGAGGDKAAVEKMAQEVYRLLRQRLRTERERYNKR